MPRYRPTNAELEAIQARVDAASGTDLMFADNLLFTELYHHERGLYPRKGKPAIWKQEKGEWVRYKRNLSRREWIEQFFPIRDKDGKIHRLVLNPPQRKLMVTIIRMERAMMPVRIQILKARQQGFSTLVQALLFEMQLRGQEVRGLIVAHNQDTSSILLAIAELGLTRMVKHEAEHNDGREEFWMFKMRAKAKSVLEFEKPIYGLTQITSAKTLGAGVGGTRSLVHFSEGSRYENADGVHSSVLPSLPDTPNTYGFDESTAFGAQGKFHSDFWEAWKQNDILMRDRMGWIAVFAAWWEHPEYAWTNSYGRGRDLPESKVTEIQNTLEAEETWLLKQKYLRRWKPDDEWEQRHYSYGHKLIRDENGELKQVRSRVGMENCGNTGAWCWTRKGVGWQNVSYDQLAWRRQKQADKMAGNDETTFNQDYPSRPEVAFRSTGSGVFDPDLLDKYEKAAGEIEPVFRGFLQRKDVGEGAPLADQVHLEPHPRGVLTIWAMPEPGRQYVIVSDTAGGGAGGDKAVVVVLDGETCDLVAGWRELCDPHRWGPKCALLGWFYNEGVLGFETQPSTHGLAAAHEAMSVGYTRMYYRRRRDSYRKTVTDVLGFHTNVETKPLFINRIKKGMESGHGIPWKELLRELKDQYWDDKGTMTSNGPDDMVDAYGIGLLIRDDCYSREIIKPPDKPLVTYEDRYWAREERRAATEDRTRSRPHRNRNPRWNR